MFFNKPKVKSVQKILEERDALEYSGYVSEKALIAREIAKHTEYFRPYFLISAEKEESDILGYLFGYKVIKQND